MDKTLWGLIISQAIIVSLFVFLHYKVDPDKEKKKFRKEQLQKFYAPLYAMLLARGLKWIKVTEMNHNQLPDRLIFVSIDNAPDYLRRDWMEKFIHENAAYASIDLLDAWANYVSPPDKCVKQEHVDQLCKAIVKEYNRLRKEFGLEYKEKELRTGIPEFYAYLYENEDKGTTQ